MPKESDSWDEQAVEDPGTCEHDWQYVYQHFDGWMELAYISICMKCRLCKSVEYHTPPTINYWHMRLKSSKEAGA